MTLLAKDPITLCPHPITGVKAPIVTATYAYITNGSIVYACPRDNSATAIPIFNVYTAFATPTSQTRTFYDMLLLGDYLFLLYKTGSSGRIFNLVKLSILTYTYTITSYDYSTGTYLNLRELLYFNGYIYTSLSRPNSGSSTVFLLKIDPDTCAIIKSLTVATGSIYGQVVGTDGTYLYMSTGVTALWKINPSTLTKVASATLSYASFVNGITADSTYIYVSNGTQSRISRYKRSTFTLTNYLYVTPDTSQYATKLWYADGYLYTIPTNAGTTYDTIRQIDTASFTVVGQLAKTDPAPYYAIPTTFQDNKFYILVDLSNTLLLLQITSFTFALDNYTVLQVAINTPKKICLGGDGRIYSLSFNYFRIHGYSLENADSIYAVLLDQIWNAGTGKLTYLNGYLYSSAVKTNPTTYGLFKLDTSTCVPVSTSCTVVTTTYCIKDICTDGTYLYLLLVDYTGQQAILDKYDCTTDTVIDSIVVGAVGANDTAFCYATASTVYTLCILSDQTLQVQKINTSDLSVVNTKIILPTDVVDSWTGFYNSRNTATMSSNMLVFFGADYESIGATGYCVISTTNLAIMGAGSVNNHYDTTNIWPSIVCNGSRICSLHYAYSAAHEIDEISVPDLALASTVNITTPYTMSNTPLILDGNTLYVCVSYMDTYYNQYCMLLVYDIISMSKANCSCTQWLISAITNTPTNYTSIGG